MEHYAKRFFGKKIEEPRDPDFIFTITGNSFSIDLENANCVIYWGNGTNNSYKGNVKASKTYNTGTYQIVVKGTFGRLSSSYGHRNKVKSIDNWGTNAASSMYYMMYDAPNMIAKWTDAPNLSKGPDISGMFFSDIRLKTSFANWDISKITVADSFLYNVDINENGTTTNYDETLISWGNQNVKPNVIVDFGNSKYSSVGKIGRDKLIAKGWRIKDGGMI